MLKMKHLSSVSSTVCTLLLASLIAAGTVGCSAFKRSDETQAPASGEVPMRAQRYSIEQSGTVRDFTTGERKFVFCTGKDCEAVSAKTPAPSLRPVVERTPKAADEAVPGVPKVKTFQVGFDYDKSTLNAAGIAVMEEAAAFAIKSAAQEIRIHGKADSYDRDAYNMKLAERRARTAERFLKGKKVEAKVIVDASIVRVTADGAYPPGETFKGRRVDLDIVIEIVAPPKK
jgi:outer membrane protein OmpA-like peptidoglycan-associated protein